MAALYRTALKGRSNPNFRNAADRECEQCRKPYRSYSKERRFCSLSCAWLWRAAASGRYRRDRNQDEIVAALLAAGCSVFDTANMGNGFPDVICAHGRENVVLLEIKNPGSDYGRRGLTARQRKFAQLFPVKVVYTKEQALTAMGFRKAA